MNTKEYVKKWIEDSLKEFSDGVFKYALYGGDLHIIKYSDDLNKDKNFINQAYNFVKSFKKEFNEDIIVIKDSDDYFDVNAFELAYNIEYIKNNNISSIEYIVGDSFQLYNASCDSTQNSYALAA